MRIEYTNPEGLMKASRFTQLIRNGGTNKTIYGSGLYSIDGEGETLGNGSLKQQAEQVLSNVEQASLINRRCGYDVCFL